MSKPVNVRETRISVPGVLRCCLATVALEHMTGDHLVSEGAKSACAHCKNPFTLRKPIKGNMVWFPDEFEFDPENC